jgi:hypothetical protein
MTSKKSTLKVTLDEVGTTLKLGKNNRIPQTAVWG